ncbi:MAG: DUF2155 domain-containing protein, partial [Alphaproteobacteria bacterium]|nr:DUF2155 domain-containing protein [Alphaproteobacteria bacterium]
MKISSLIAISLLLSWSALAQETNPENIDPTRFTNSSQIQILNKITAKTSLLTIKTGDKMKFGSLVIVARKCWQAPLDQKPESKIFLDVSEIKNDEQDQSREIPIFSGWMFASSPSIASIE